MGNESTGAVGIETCGREEVPPEIEKMSENAFTVVAWKIPGTVEVETKCKNILALDGCTTIHDLSYL